MIEVEAQEMFRKIGKALDRVKDLLIQGREIDASSELNGDFPPDEHPPRAYGTLTAITYGKGSIAITFDGPFGKLTWEVSPENGELVSDENRFISISNQESTIDIRGIGESNVST